MSASNPTSYATQPRRWQDLGVAVGTTIGFPHGEHNTAVKWYEAERALADGARELDMVVNIGDVLSGKWIEVTSEIKQIAALAHANGGLVKVIFENCYLRDEHKIRLCQALAEAGADYVKTSTGYGTGGATMEDLELMRRFFHCTAGKDRTGIVSALLLLILEVPREVVVGDYSLTALYTCNRIPAADQWFAERGIEPERAAHVLSARREAMEVTLAHLDAVHGGAERFVREKAGLGEAEIAALRGWLIE